MEKEEIYKYIKSIGMDIIVALVGVAYVFYQMVTLEVTELNPLTLIAGAIVGIVCGVVIKQALGENGFTKGYASDSWNRENDTYNDTCEDVVDFMPLVDNFYLCLEKEKKENYRRALLQGQGLRYSDWFDEEGNFLRSDDDIKALPFKKRIIVKKARSVKIKLLNLFSEYSTTINNPKDREVTDKGQRRKNFSKNTINAVAIAIIGVYFVPVLNHWSWASFISSTMQVTLWVLFGFLQMLDNYNFITQDKVSVLRKKKELIRKFEKGAKEGLYDHPPFYKEEKESE